MVSALLVTLIAGTVATALISNTDFTAAQHQQSEAQDLAQQDQERLKGLSAEQLNDLSQTYSTTLDSTNFSVTSQAWYLNGTSGATCTGAGGANATYFKTISTVKTTPASTGTARTLATDESVIAPPAGGGILTQVHDQTTLPLSGVTVTASGPETDAATTDANGCTVFSAVPSGSYNMTETDAGYVDPNGNASPLATTANVSSQGLAWPANGNPVEMGLGGGITGNFKTTYSASTYPAAADGLSWFSTGGGGIPMAKYRFNAQPTTASIQTTTAPGTTASSMGLFPFATALNPASYTNNYQVWAGTCVQEQPPVGQDMFTVTPGSSNTQNILEPALDLTVTFPSGGVPKSVLATDVKSTFTSTAGSGTACTDEWGPVTASTAGPANAYYVYGLPFASSATSGAGASGSGETGGITVCADYTSGGTSYEGTTPSFTDSYSGATAETIALTTGSTKGKCP